MWKLSITVTQQRAADLSTLFEDYALSVSWFEVNEQQNIWNLDIIFDDKPDENWLKSLLPHDVFECHAMANVNWLRHNQVSFPTFTVGPFYIYGSHHDNLPPPHSLAFKIDAATAFGTGEHATTQGCLLLLEYLHGQGHEFNSILDLGCGTGILGMAATRLFNQHVVMLSDNDPEAVTMTQYNIEQNNLTQHCHVILSQGLEASELLIKAPYDLIIANILANPLIELAPSMNEYTTFTGTLILSGILNSQADQVIHAYSEQNFACIKQHIIKEWSALLFIKNL